jgi:hypothetical protein
MEMITIVVTVCTLAQPEQCEDRHLEFSWQGSLKQCVMNAQPYIAQWVGEHPKWSVKSFHCEHPHTKEKADARGSARQT